MPDFEILTKMAIDAAIAGGEKIIEVYNSEEIDVTYKIDSSPLTEADLRSNEIIKEYLSKSELQILVKKKAKYQMILEKTGIFSGWLIHWMARGNLLKGMGNLLSI